jgi:hypothetical protein
VPINRSRNWIAGVGSTTRNFILTLNCSTSAGLGAPPGGATCHCLRDCTYLNVASSGELRAVRLPLLLKHFGHSTNFITSVLRSPSTSFVVETAEAVSSGQQPNSRSRTDDSSREQLSDPPGLFGSLVETNLRRFHCIKPWCLDAHPSRFSCRCFCCRPPARIDQPFRTRNSIP